MLKRIIIFVFQNPEERADITIKSCVLNDNRSWKNKIKKITLLLDHHRFFFNRLKYYIYMYVGVCVYM